MRDVGPVRHVHVDEELAAFAEWEHLLGQAGELRHRQHDQHDAGSQHERRETQGGGECRGIEALYTRRSRIFTARRAASADQPNDQRGEDVKRGDPRAAQCQSHNGRQ